MPPHRIRLGPPWAESAGVHARRFGRPHTLAPDERVWLVCDVPADAVVTLNGQEVPPSADVTELLAARNQVAIRLPPDGVRGEVALEIRSGS